MKLTRIFALILVALLAIVPLASCSPKTSYTVGICQLITHDALDAATKGFKDALIDRLGEENVTFIEQNAAGSADTCVTIVNDFVSKNVDLILANATPALQAAANATLDIPILGTSITEYGVALNIDNFSGVVGGNISGTSDLASLDAQAQMILDVVPTAKKVGLIYCSSEDNSIYQVNQVSAFLESKGVQVVKYPFADSNDVAMIAQRAAAECDALYAPTDNVVASNGTTIYEAMTEKKPLIAGESGILVKCGVVTLSISYYNLGYKTGEMAADILTGKTDISTLPIAYDPNPVKYYNAAICAELGITPPEGFIPFE